MWNTSSPLGSSQRPPPRHAERRHIRTNVLSKTLQRLSPVKHVYYVDAHPGEDEGGITAVVGPLNYELVTTEPDVHTIDDLETRPVARAIDAATTHIVHPQTPIIIVTDSRAACRQLTRNDLHPRTARLIKDALDDRRHMFHIIWTPGNEGLSGNELAYALARATIYRAPEQLLSTLL